MSELPLRQRNDSVRICRTCSHIEPVTVPHGDGCTSRDWQVMSLVEPLATDSDIVMPHPDGGWPEVKITHTYMVRSDDPEVVERVRVELVRESAEATA